MTPKPKEVKRKEKIIILKRYLKKKNKKCTKNQMKMCLKL